MPKIKFTKSAIDKLPLTRSGQVDYFDTDTPGLGLRVGTTTKTFFVKVDVADQASKSGYRSVRKTLGRYGELTLEQAKRELEGYDDKEKGFVPGKRLELKRGDVSANGAEISLRDLLGVYFKERRTKSGERHKQATVDGYTRRIERHFADWLDLKLPEVIKLSPDVLIEKHKQIEADSGPMEARNAIVMLKAIVGYGCLKYPVALPFNPLRSLTHKDAHVLAPIKERDECLKGDDFQAFYEGIKQFNEVTCDCYLFTLYTGMRHMEAAALRWEYVDLAKKTVFIPDTKNRQPLHVPLSRQSLEILERRKAQAVEGSPFVFPAQRLDLNKTGHVRLLAEALRSRTVLKITVHALRRTFITTGRRLKLFEDVERLTNHVDSSVTGRHYDQTDVDDLRQPLQVICNEIERLMTTGISAKVINFNA